MAPSLTDAAIAQLDDLAATATAVRPAYGRPDALAALLRARQRFFHGGCLRAQAAEYQSLKDHIADIEISAVETEGRRIAGLSDVRSA